MKDPLVVSHFSGRDAIEKLPETCCTEWANWGKWASSSRNKLTMRRISQEGLSNNQENVINKRVQVFEVIAQLENAVGGIFCEMVNENHNSAAFKEDA